MASTITTTNIPVASQFTSATDVYVNRTGTSDWIKVTGTVIVQYTGDTYFEAVVERSSLDPSGTPNIGSVDVVKAKTSTINPMTYNEPYAAWWRVRVVNCSGGTLTVNITGGAA